MHGGAAAASEFWALQDVSLEVQPGEVVGFIGRNGAGKSTLLKILSRIVEPTSGRAEVRGRIGSLLEVGTGFHPELTGRENVYLNGSILGMSRKEIAKQFDEIVAFAGIEQFLDTPVKRYSSGMYVRLGFAVAAHLNLDIMVVDEVLAVGDTAFQAKCMGKMTDINRQGRTVLFVSHSMAAVSSLCTRVVALNKGRAWADGGSEVIQDYLNSIFDTATSPLGKRAEVIDDKKVWLTGISFKDAAGRQVAGGISGQDFTICLEYQSRTIDKRPDFALGIYSGSGHGLYHCDTAIALRDERPKVLPARGVVECTIPRLPLAAGTYRINILIHRDGVAEDHVEGAGKFVVKKGDFYGTSRNPPPNYPPTLVGHTWAFLPDA
jgi:lipopolysaccharide transport system ATP-binding protein